ncbi:hypothetical protein [Vaginisenegalia massiliensis]|uniref:hypothetical protein n=1 Tax=Vaginisenegalia massiliensis TaxID=2058294 RepID=UPI000F545EB1|nr:hypothetical protein [Vaginisenegalia massiliensis]
MNPFKRPLFKLIASLSLVMSLSLPSIVLAQETPSNQASNDIVGVWQASTQGPAFVVTKQSIYLNKQFYQLKQVEKNSAVPNIDTYTLHFDTAKFVKDYGQAALENELPFTWQYNQTMDTLTGNFTYYRQIDLNTVTSQKEELLKTQPINAEHLSTVLKNSISGYSEIARQEDIPQAKVNRFIYDQIVKEYPDLGLLKGDEYGEYLKISRQLPDFKWEDLNKANPADVLSWYREAAKVNKNDKKKIAAALKNKIQAAIKEFDQRMSQAEKEGLKTTSTDSSSQDASNQDETSKDETNAQKDQPAVDSNGKKIEGVKAEAVDAIKKTYPTMAGSNITYIVTTDQDDKNVIVVEVYAKGDAQLNLMGIFHYLKDAKTIQQIQ